MPVPIMLATTMQVAVNGEIDFGPWDVVPELTGDDVRMPRDGVNADRLHRAFEELSRNSNARAKPICLVQR